MRDLDPPPAGQVPVEMELLLKLQGLIPGVGLPSPLPGWICGREDALALQKFIKKIYFFVSLVKKLYNAQIKGVENKSLLLE